MLKAIGNVIFGFTAVVCGLIGCFWLWFSVEYGLKPITNFEQVGWQVLADGTSQPFWNYLFVAGVWFALAIGLAWLQRRRMQR